MEDWFLGYCESCPDGTRPGRVLILASLRRNTHGQYVVGRRVDDLRDETGPSGYAFWPQFPAPLQNLTGALVRFRPYRGVDHGDLSTTRDWLKINKSPNGDWDIHRIGHRIIEQDPDLQWRHEPRWVKNVPEGEQIFVHQRTSSSVVGLWRVGQEIQDISGARTLIPHSKPNLVFEFAVKDLAPDCIYSERLAPGLLLEALLYTPDEAQGQPVDLATPKQLAKWLVDRLVATAPQVVSEFDREAPGWRTRIKEEIEGYSDLDRRICRSRWQQIEAVLNDLVLEAEDANKLMQLPAFLARVDELVAAQVTATIGRRANEIEAKALETASGLIQSYDEETEKAKREFELARCQLEAVERDIQARIEVAEARELAVQKLQSHLQESRERLLKDLALYQSLLPGIAAPPTSPLTCPTGVTEAAKQPRAAIKPAGPPITDKAAFIDSRLWPNLDRWQPGVPRTLSVITHAALCGSRAAIIPSPAWARAYADALGAFARLTVVNVEPTWLGFEDLWRGGLGLCWERASQDESMIELVLLRDFNRALPQCYARPLLDMIAGYCDTLPAPANGCWPKTLRMLACPAPRDEALPLTAEVVRHFAAVQRVPAATGSERPKPLTLGHVTTETWCMWASAASAAELDQDLVNELGPLACAAATDAATIREILMALGMPERAATRTSKDMRISDPMDYLDDCESADGESR